MEGITTAGTGYLRPQHWPARDWEALPHSHRVHILCSQAVPLNVPRQPDRAVYARLEAGRWLAECGGCPSAQFVHPADPWYCCVGTSCPWAASWARVIWLDEDERVAVERAAVQRPVDDRNWIHRDHHGKAVLPFRVLTRLIPSPNGAAS